jgi:hypothetical protein
MMAKGPMIVECDCSTTATAAPDVPGSFSEMNREVPGDSLEPRSTPFPS